MNKYLYPLLVISTGIQFFLIYLATNLSTLELGIYSLLNSILIFLLPTARFDGCYLCISNIITISQLRKWSKSTNTLFVILVTPIIVVTYAYENYLALSLFLISCISLYSNWGIDLNTIEISKIWVFEAISGNFKTFFFEVRLSFQIE